MKIHTFLLPPIVDLWPSLALARRVVFGAVISDVDGYHGEGMLRRIRGRLLRCPTARSRR
jgi:hypothetical protein